MDKDFAAKMEREKVAKGVHYNRYEDSLEGLRATIDRSPFMSELLKAQMTIFVKGYFFITVPVLEEAPLAREFYSGEK